MRKSDRIPVKNFISYKKGSKNGKKPFLDSKIQERFPITIDYGLSAEKEQGIWMGRRAKTPKEGSL